MFNLYPVMLVSPLKQKSNKNVRRMIKHSPVFLLSGFLLLFGGGACGSVGGEDNSERPIPFIEADLVPIPAGCFDMGNHFNNNSSQDLPVHNVCLAEFEIYIHEVTNAEYSACVSVGGCTAPLYSASSSREKYYENPQYNDFPVIGITWYKAHDFCEWAGKRLPTEAEWEYAARGGENGKRYSWGDPWLPWRSNYWDSGDPWDNDTSPVEYYGPNGYGLYDMTGNVYEWVEDDWHGHYNGAPDDGSAWVSDPRSGHRVLRGGSWVSDQNAELVVSGRTGAKAFSEEFSVGFRCVW